MPSFLKFLMLIHSVFFTYFFFSQMNTRVIKCSLIIKNLNTFEFKNQFIKFVIYIIKLIIFNFRSIKKIFQLKGLYACSLTNHRL